MREVKLFLLLVAFVAVFSSYVIAEVEVNGYTFETNYSPGETIKGFLNLTLTNHDYLSFVTSSLGDSISLGDFLQANADARNFSFTCIPNDCSSNYDVGEGSTSISVPITLGTTKTVGFVLYGDNVLINSIDFTVTSDFGTEEGRPIKIEFFEEEEWLFNKFSEEYTGKNYGCYDSSAAVYSGFFIGGTPYCEQIFSHETNSFYIGVRVGLEDTKDLLMSVYGIDGSLVTSCEFNPNTEDGCKTPSEIESFPLGYYDVCVSSVNNDLTDYKIFTDSTGESCGYFGDGVGSVENSIVDYAIFSSGAKFADASSLGDLELNFIDLANAADRIVDRRYDRDCTNGCALPIKLKGLIQNLVISDINIGYSDINGNLKDNQVYSLSEISALVETVGTVDLSLTKFNITSSGEYTLFIGEDEIVKKNVKQLPSPIIVGVSPINPPAGVPISFFVDVTNVLKNASLTYNWDFGDNTKITTKTNNVTHTYKEISSYTLILEVIGSDGLKSTKSFNIITLKPKSAIAFTLVSKREAFEEFVKGVRRYSVWYGEAFENTIKVQDFYDALDSLERLESSAVTNDDYLFLAKELYDLKIPINLEVSVESGFSFLTSIEDIDPKVVANFAGGISGDDLEGYSEAILRWQTQNIESTINSNILSIDFWSGEKVRVFRTYELSINSFSDTTSYLVINKPFSEVFFKDSIKAERQGENTIIVIEPNEQEKKFEFYVEDGEPVSFFVAPRLSEIVVEVLIDPTCNYNNVCEEGEDHNTCRADCKPVKLAGFYVFLVVFFVLVLYSILQFWYKVHYENFLFGGNRKELFNLLNFITNARSRGVLDSEIRKGLRKQGWSLERVNYTLKKSRGTRTGMFELLPFEKIESYFRNRKIAKEVAIGKKQQNDAKVNKYPYRNIRRK
ncbi:MAG: PKD domain-containing protein [Nanoarchaeota archaeon]|nr:PKD domain-containing protein [Nanoarchaeota archaeon]